jgi:hypothetical protein
VEADPLPANPYTELRRRLLAAHQLTDIQRVEHLFILPPLAAQKPSKLFAEMLRLCRRDQEKNAFFNCLLLNKLPRELRILLSEADKQALGAREDLFAAHNMVAAVFLQEQEGEESTVAAWRRGRTAQSVHTVAIFASVHCACSSKKQNDPYLNHL